MPTGLSAARLYRYRDEGHLEHLGRDLYRRANAAAAGQNLIEIAHWVSEGSLCLITAFARHGLTDVIPDRIPALQAPANVHVFANDTFGVGRGEIRNGDGHYSAERSLVDVVRLRPNTCSS
jgi:predicted transcriptional regulator of viral defense system